MEQADREGVHVIHTDGYDHLHERLRSLSQNMLLDYDIRSGMRAVLSQLVNRRPKLTPNRRAILTPLSGTAEVVPVVNRGDPSGFV